jgi:hypothetical protein
MCLSTGFYTKKKSNVVTKIPALQNEQIYVRLGNEFAPGCAADIVSGT